MSDNELEEYLKTIEPNFDSHIEKGTIEMSNEYYNLLEERMIRLLNENKQLKDGLHKILDLNKRAINCDSQKVNIKYLLKQYDLIYETLGELQPGLMKGNKE